MQTEHFNKLSESELERVALLLEEASEIVSICGKILRHGFDSHSPDDPDKKTNRVLLAKEIVDTIHAVTLLSDNSDIDMSDVDDMLSKRNLKVKKYLHHQNTEE